MTQTSRRTGRAAALSVAVSLATVLIASACSAPATRQAGDTTSGSRSGAALPDGSIDRGIQLPGTVPGDRLDADPVSPPHHHHRAGGTETADAVTAGRHRHVHPWHAHHTTHVHHRKAHHHAKHATTHPTTAVPPATTKPGTKQPAVSKPVQQAKPTQPARPAQPASKPAAQATSVSQRSATDRRSPWIGTPAEHPVPVFAGRSAVLPETADPVVIPVDMPAKEGPLRPDTVIPGPGFQIDMRQRPAAPAPGTMAPLVK